MAQNRMACKVATGRRELEESREALIASNKRRETTSTSTRTKEARSTMVGDTDAKEGSAETGVANITTRRSRSTRPAIEIDVTEPSVPSRRLLKTRQDF